ncbi:M48 family metalloprotease [Reichenbachiella sp.]|uniref:M48 family metalloprotease n=1 Tax=Reichenbachiella sp. TaxID=2184521 RepID=UPI003BB1C43F
MLKKEVKVSSGFKSQTSKAIVSIVFFAFIYILLLLLTIALTAVSIYGGLMLVALKPTFITIALGIGLASLGILVLIFLLKFIFKSHKVDRSHLIEITEREEPELFALIQDLVNEVGTSFPKKVYLSADVNASVFYDSSFWSMILPIKKNLQIGMGLINTVTHSELKSILAHEFGHFSQNSMKVGSYVYNVNQIIFNMLYDNESYDRIIQSWAGVSGYFSIFVVLAVKIIAGIQWILRGVYEIVNKAYMGLSREMEFHADEIAAHVTGYEPLKSSLLRMEMADYAFNNLLSFYESKVQQNITSENLYPEHISVINILSRDNNLKFENGLPQVTFYDLNKFNKSKLVIEDQWASHPSTKDRIERLEKLQLEKVETNNDPAVKIFGDIISTQQRLTKLVFEEAKYEGDITKLDQDTFLTSYKEAYAANTFPKLFNGYYDNKNPLTFDLDSIEVEKYKTDLNELFSSQKIDQIWGAIGLNDDIQTLTQIADKVIPVKTFDYDGCKYNRKETRSLIQNLKAELEKKNEEIKQNDIAIFRHFKSLENNLDGESNLTSLYNELFEFDSEYENNYKIYIDLSNQLQFINFTTPFDKIKINFQNIIPLENKLKEGIKDMLSNKWFQEELTEEIKKNFELYLSKEWKYFYNEAYDESNLEVIFTAMNNYAFLLSRGFFLLKKKLLCYKEEIFLKSESNIPTENFS